MSDQRSPHSEVIPSLDGLRAISVLIVALAHSGLEDRIPGGIGVTIFFFLSGYLITTLMLIEHARTGRISIALFYARRVFRLMPPLLITLVVAYGLTYAGVLDGRITWQGLASQLLYFANYYGIFFDPGNTTPDGTGVLWSLAVEEHFYIFYPLCMVLLLNRGLASRTIAVLLAVACLVILAWRIHLAQLPGFSTFRTYYASDTRIDSIVYGCILALTMNPMQDVRRRGAMSAEQWLLLVVALGMMLGTVLYRGPLFRETIRYSLQGLALLPIFYLAIRYSDNWLFRHLNSPWLKRLGVYSYAIYLIHHIVIRFVVKNAPELASHSAVIFPIALMVSIGFAAAVDRIIDPYFRQLRRKYSAAAPAPFIARCDTTAKPPN